MSTNPIKTADAENKIEPEQDRKQTCRRIPIKHDPRDQNHQENCQIYPAKPSGRVIPHMFDQA
jgi:hypothetical protein